MRIERVTMTGADDTVRDPQGLLYVSQQWPFVEWGILVSNTRGGSSRFPSMEWMEQLAKLAYMQLSLHVCGRWVRQICQGDFSVSDDLASIWHVFRRVQLNFHAMIHEIDRENFFRALNLQSHKEFIFQIDNVNNELLHEALEAGCNAVPLFDTSGGAGIVPKDWPRPVPNIFCGYAGGLGPNTLRDELKRIEDAVEDATIWIDMETRVRNDRDEFDLNMVQQCLEIAEPYLGR